MDAQKSADKLRHTVERAPGPNPTKEKERREDDTVSAEAHADLTQPELSSKVDRRYMARQRTNRVRQSPAPMARNLGAGSLSGRLVVRRFPVNVR
jgi:hypothetical protein